MARYTGPKTKIARKFGEPSSEKIKRSSAATIPPASTARTSVARLLNTVFSFAKSRKLNIHTVFSKSSSATFSKRLHASKVSPVLSCFSFSNLVLTT